MFSPSGGNPAKEPAPVTGVQRGTRGGGGFRPTFMDDGLGNYE